MSDDLNRKIKQIADLLGQESMPDNVKGLLNMLAASGPSEEAPPKATEAYTNKDERSGRSELEENMEMMRKVKKIMDKMNTNNDPRVNLLTAIRPFLSTKRQKKINSCIKIINMSGLARLLDDNDINNL